MFPSTYRDALLMTRPLQRQRIDGSSSIAPTKVVDELVRMGRAKVDQDDFVMC
jgi:hypothetical protein